MIPITITRTRPATSTKVMIMFTTTDSVMPMKLMMVRMATKNMVTSSTGGRSKIEPK